ncbi:MAG: phosphopentomutase [Firmicutes bacterium]|nr:phosphopentomutase [Bacillota bacterium]
MIGPTPGHKPPRNGGRRGRVIVAILDGAGAGAAPDAADYGDQGAQTLRSVITAGSRLSLPHLYSLGLHLVLGLPALLPESEVCGYYGRLAPHSPGKDTTSGHWELAGLVLARPFPTYPDGFPPAIIAQFEKAIGRKVLGNLVASGTEIIEQLGRRHLDSGGPIVYTSADSVFQIAAHEKVVPVETLYSWCRTARQILRDPHGVGRVIARPFVGRPGSFQRTPRRRDYSLPPPGETILDRVHGRGLPVGVIGKVADIFDHRGITAHLPGKNNDQVFASLLKLMGMLPEGLIWATFGDFDSLYGHRNDVRGFARALEQFDRWIPLLKEKMDPKDLFLISADHGCDPSYPGTDHTREYVPLLAWHSALSPGIDAVNLGSRSGMADFAAGIAGWLALPPLVRGNNFLS